MSGLKSDIEKGVMQGEWKTFDEQVKELLRALKVMRPGSAGEKKSKAAAVAAKVKKLCDKEGVRGETRGSLAKLLLGIAQKLQEEEQEISTQLEEATFWSRRKFGKKVAGNSGGESPRNKVGCDMPGGGALDEGEKGGA